MIQTKQIAPNVLKIIAPETLQSGDFLELAPQVDALIAKQGTIRLLIDASKLDGWANTAAVEKHMLFVKEHQHKVERIAIIIQHEWQHWFVSAVRLFLHPEVKAFRGSQEADAVQWITHGP